MKDAVFKNLLHRAKGYERHSSGGEIAKGYKPDYSLKKGNEFIILECDTGTSRKGYVGAVTKASKFLTGEKNGVLVLVMKEKGNTTVIQISNHLQPYLEWLRPLTNLKIVFVIAIDHYCPDEEPLELLEQVFYKKSTKIHITNVR